MYCKISLPGYFLKPPPERVIWGSFSAIPIRDYGCDVPKMAERWSVFQISPRYRMRKEPVAMLCKTRRDRKSATEKSKVHFCRMQKDP